MEEKELDDEKLVEELLFKEEKSPLRILLEGVDALYSIGTVVTCSWWDDATKVDIFDWIASVRRTMAPALEKVIDEKHEHDRIKEEHDRIKKEHDRIKKEHEEVIPFVVDIKAHCDRLGKAVTLIEKNISNKKSSAELPAIVLGIASISDSITSLIKVISTLLGCEKETTEKATEEKEEGGCK